MSGSEEKGLVALGAGIIFGAVAFFKGFKVRDKKRLIENIPTSTVRGMAVGLVEVKGKANPVDQPLLSHFSKAPCVFFRYTVEELRSSGKRSRWVTIASYSSSNYFYLEDDTGKVFVDPLSAELHLQVDREFSSAFGGKAKPEFLTGLTELGIDPKGFLGVKKSLRCAETYIAPGDLIYVMGSACPAVSGEFSECGHENLCIRKDNAPIFFISDHSEKELLKNLGRQMIFMLYGGPILTVVCLFLLIALYFRQYL
ncbi:MAG TPA: hypothetical protein DIS66_00840 [Candidatus Omnitrophica bacterium]|nr:hypothetical protein [Candidatus Omnitrophota bacterium]